jgi:hypothetical protein
MEVYRQREGLYVKMWWKRGCEEKEAPTVQLITPLAFVCDEATPEREPEGRSLGGAVPIVENTAGPIGQCVLRQIRGYANMRARDLYGLGMHSIG